MAHIQNTYSGLWKPEDRALDKISSQKMFQDNIDSLNTFVLLQKTNMNTNIADIAALRAINTTDTVLYPENKLVFVKSHGWFYFSRTGTASDNRITTIKPTTGGGRWIAVRDKSTIADMTIYVATTGSDTTGDGSSGSPFRTIQYAIDSLPSEINHTVTINLAVGNYAEIVKISGFNGKGTIYIYGDTTSTSLTTYITSNIIIDRCTCYVSITGIVANTTTTSGFYANVSTYVGFYYCIATSVSASYDGFAITGGSSAIIDHCIISNRRYGIYATYNGRIFSNTNTGSGNNIGIISSYGGIISKNGTQPAGTTTEAKTSGGQIIDANGYQIGIAKSPTQVSITLAAASWTGSSAPYTYTATVAGVLATGTDQDLSPDPNITLAQLTALQGANIVGYSQTTNSVVLRAWGTKPTIDVPVIFTVRRNS